MNIEEICEYYGITKYTINPDGSIDVKGDVNLYLKGLKKLPLTFNKVSGSFMCHENALTTLKGAPKVVGKYFLCHNNLLTNLEGAPLEVGIKFDCSSNELTSLKGDQRKVGEIFDCDNNKLTNLKYVPDCKFIYCVGNNIPLYEMRYIFMHKVNQVHTGNFTYNEILNQLLKEDKPITEKIQELQKYVN